MDHAHRFADLLDADTLCQREVKELLLPKPKPDWSKLPPTWTFGDASDFLLLLDGYRLASKYFPAIAGDEREIGAAFKVYVATVSSLRAGAIDQLCALQIWIALFWQCKSDAWNNLNPKNEDRPELETMWCALTKALGDGRYFPDVMQEIQLEMDGDVEASNPSDLFGEIPN